MLKRLKDIYSRQIFMPGWLGILVNPFYFARAGLHKAMIEFAPNVAGCLLDVGCGSKPYRSLFNVDVYTGLEFDNGATRKAGAADFYYDGHTFPFTDGAFDSVLCNQVLEHVFNPDEFLAEINRVLKPGGKLLLTVPFVWDEHEQPNDYARYSSFGLNAILVKQGFRVLLHKKLGADPSIIFQLANAYLYKVTRNLPRAINLLITVTLMSVINLSGLLARRMLPGNPDLFLDNVVLVEKPL